MQCHVFRKPLGAANGLNQRSTAASTFSLSVTRHAESRQINVCGWYLATSPSEYRTRAELALPAPFYKVIFIFVELSGRIISQGGGWVFGNHICWTGKFILHIDLQYLFEYIQVILSEQAKEMLQDSTATSAWSVTKTSITYNVCKLQITYLSRMVILK